MAVNLLGSSNARISYGDIAGLSGATGLTVVITVNASSIASDERLVGQWGPTAGEQCFTITMASADEVGFVVKPGPGLFRGRQTTAANLTTSTVYRIVCRWRGSDGAMAIDINGVSQSITTWIANDAIAALPDATSSVQVGHDTASAVDGIDADYSEFGIWTEYKDDAFAYAYGIGYCPRFFRSSGLLYSGLLNTSNIADEWGGVAGTNTSGTTGSHPSVIYPTHKKIWHVAAAAGGTTFPQSISVQAVVSAFVQRQGNLVNTNQAGHSVSVQRQGNLNIASRAVGTASLVSAQLVRIVAISVTAKVSVLITRLGQLSRSATAAHSITAQRQGNLTNTCTSPHSVSIQRQGNLNLGATAAHSVTIAVQLVKIIAIAVQAVVSAALQRQANLVSAVTVPVSATMTLVATIAPVVAAAAARFTGFIAPVFDRKRRPWNSRRNRE